jgi:SAM-dependent methyltransferase
MDNYLHPGDRLFELGYGNGRDSLWFVDQGVFVYAVDQSGYMPRQVKDGLLHDRLSSMRRALFKTEDFTANRDVVNSVKYDAVYSRFTWHAINSSDEHSVLGWVPQVLKREGWLLIECRSVYDDMYGDGKRIECNTYYQDGHHRRFLEPGELVSKLTERGFDRIELACAKGLAAHGSEDPRILRVCAQWTRG